MASKDSDNEASKELQNELNQMKQKMKANLELIAMRKFPQKITQWMQLRKTLAQEIATVKNSPVACTIPVPDSLHENQAKLKASPDTVQDLLKLNPNLQCFQLNHHPQLLKNCQMSTNTAMVELIEKILPHLIELDDDLNKLDYALRLMLPRMREGEYLGTEFLHEAISQINDLQGLAQQRIRHLYGYNFDRYELLKSIISYGHLEDYRLKLTRKDKAFCYDLTRCVHFLFRTHVTVYDMVKKNSDKLAEFKSMAEDNKEFEFLF